MSIVDDVAAINRRMKEIQSEEELARRLERNIRERGSLCEITPIPRSRDPLRREGLVPSRGRSWD